MRVGDNDGGPANFGKLGDGRCAGPGDHDMGSRHPARHVFEERGQFDRNSGGVVFRPDPVDIFGPALLCNREPPAQHGRPTADGLRDDIAENRRPLTAAKDENFNALAIGTDLGIVLVAGSAERCADRISGDDHLGRVFVVDADCFVERRCDSRNASGNQSVRAAQYRVLFVDDRRESARRCSDHCRHGRVAAEADNAFGTKLSKKASRLDHADTNSNHTAYFRHHASTDSGGTYSMHLYA